MDFGLHFAPAGNVTAATLGVPAPDCGPKAQAVIGPSGVWECQGDTGTGGGGGWAMLLLAAAALWILVPLYTKRAKSTYQAVKRGDMEAVL